jgi:hypothetical protein
MNLLADLQQLAASQWQNLMQNIGVLLWLGAGGTLAFLFGKLRERMFLSVQAEIKKRSRLRPGTAAGHKQIHQELLELLKKLEAFRVNIFQFHNGDNFMLSNHAWKVSCTHEALDPGARATFMEVQSLPISHMADWVGPVIDSDMKVAGVVEFPDVSGAPQRSVLFNVEAMNMTHAKFLAVNQGVGYALSMGLVDSSRKSIFGFISVQFQDCSASKLESLKTQVYLIAEVVSRVQFYLADDFRSFDRKSWSSRVWNFILGKP